MLKYCLCQICGQYSLGIVLIESDKSYRVFPGLDEEALEKEKSTTPLNKIGQIVTKKRIALVLDNKEALIERTKLLFSQIKQIKQLKSEFRTEELSILKEHKS